MQPRLLATRSGSMSWSGSTILLSTPGWTGDVSNLRAWRLPPASLHNLTRARASALGPSLREWNKRGGRDSGRGESYKSSFPGGSASRWLRQTGRGRWAAATRVRTALCEGSWSGFPTTCCLLLNKRWHVERRHLRLELKGAHPGVLSQILTPSVPPFIPGSISSNPSQHSPAYWYRNTFSFQHKS